jgi:hypothetical protein
MIIGWDVEAAKWRKQAAEARTAADQMQNATAQEMMRRVAEGYDQLAERAERRGMPPYGR